MKKLYLLLSVVCFVLNFSVAQNVGIGNPTPTEKLHVDSGNIKIGNAVWSPTNKSFLKFGDANYITIGEEEEDDQLTIRSKGLFIRPPALPFQTVAPITIQGTNYLSHFFFGPNEDTYIRGGKNGSNVNINDANGGRVGIGMSSPTRSMLEQNGVVGNTAAIFGGEGAGISLQRNFPAIGFNHYSDAAGHKSIGQGYGAQMGLNQTNGTLYLASFPFVTSANQVYPSFNQRLFISRFGKVGIGADNPYADLEITQRPNAYDGSNEDVDMGITYKGTVVFPGGNVTSNWNTHVGYGQIGQFSSEYNYSFWTENPTWGVKAAINTDGSYWQASDKDLKKNINYLQNSSSLEKIMLLKPASYIFKEQPDNHPLSYGFIAQDLEKIFPEMVMQTKTNKLVSYSSFIPILTKGIQEQQQQIDNLKQQVDELKKQVQLLLNKQ
jgi:Chaperone of endosialidase